MRKVGKVTIEEKDEIKKLFERRNGLVDLTKILNTENVELYEKVIKDLGETNTKFQNWWNNMKKKYLWESADNGRWQIDFDSCDIFLITND